MVPVDRADVPAYKWLDEGGRVLDLRITYARIVLEHAVRRRYISAGQQVAELAWNQRKNLDTVKQRAEALVLGASSDTLSRRAVLPPSEWTEHLMDYLG